MPAEIIFSYHQQSQWLRFNSSVMLSPCHGILKYKSSTSPQNILMLYLKTEFQSMSVRQPIYPPVHKFFSWPYLLYYMAYCALDITLKDAFCLVFYLDENILILIDHILLETICLVCQCVLFSNI